MLSIVVLLTISFASIYYTIWYLDKPKVSAPKTVAALLIAFVINNVALYVGVPRFIWGEWVVPIAAIFVGLLLMFKLKPLHVVTITGACVACRLLAIYLLFFLIPGFL